MSKRRGYFWLNSTNVHRTADGWDCQVEVVYVSETQKQLLTETLHYASRWWIGALWNGRRHAIKQANRMLEIIDAELEPGCDLPFEDGTDNVVLTRE